MYVCMFVLFKYMYECMQVCMFVHVSKNVRYKQAYSTEAITA